MEKIIELQVHSEDDGERADKFLASKIEELTRACVQKLIKENFVTVNEKSINKNYRVNCNDIIKIIIPEPKELKIEAKNIPLDIVYEDNDILLVNKPKGMVVHPAVGTDDNTLVHALLYHCKNSLSGINGVLRPGIVHRIDKNTTGLLIVAKNDIAHKNLAVQIKEHTFKREYEAIVYGNVKNDNGIIDLPIGRHPQKRKQMAVCVPNAKPATTLFSVKERYDKFTYIRLTLKTGRTHQIRVHMSYYNHPIAGDDVYGPKKIIKSLNGQCLHARCIGFIHPISGKYMEFETNLPDYFTEFQHLLLKKENEQ